MSKELSPTIYADLSLVEQDKIIKLCTTYGLNEEETKQLISELRMGASIDMEPVDNPPADKKLASIVSAKNEEMSFNDSDFKFESEYSFKPALKGAQGLGITSQEHSFEKALIGRMKDEEDRFEEIRAENALLAQEKAELQSKVNVLLEMKAQENDIIVGLKNAVCALTNLLKDKEQAYGELHENYERLASALQEKLNTERDVYQRPEKDYARKEQRPSRESVLTEVQMSANFERKQSKELSKTKSSQNINQRLGDMRPSLKWEDSRGVENKELQPKMAPKKQNKLDMGKYKVFIDELKNICANKPHRA